MRRSILWLVPALVAAFFAAGPFGAQAPAPDLVILNAKVYTVDEAFSTAQAVAISGGKFSAVGTSADVRRLAGANTRVIDVGGKTITPGLADDHLHNAGGGPGVDLSRA